MPLVHGCYKLRWQSTNFQMRLHGDDSRKWNLVLNLCRWRQDRTSKQFIQWVVWLFNELFADWCSCGKNILVGSRSMRLIVTSKITLLGNVSYSQHPGWCQREGGGKEIGGVSMSSFSHPMKLTWNMHRPLCIVSSSCAKLEARVCDRLLHLLLSEGEKSDKRTSTKTQRLC